MRYLWIWILEDFFEVDGSEMEGEGWWESMLGFSIEEIMGLFNLENFLEPVELAVLDCFTPGLLNNPLLTKPSQSTPPPFGAAASNQMCC